MSATANHAIIVDRRQSCSPATSCSPESPGLSCPLSSDTYEGVVCCLEQCDPSYPPSFYCALEAVKRYGRSKIAKQKRNHFVMKGGKLESLEAKFAHLGYQDIFYLTRLQLSLPPSHRTLPCPTEPVLHILQKAKYPLRNSNCSDVAAEKKSGKLWWKLKAQPCKIHTGGERSFGTLG